MKKMCVLLSILFVCSVFCHSLAELTYTLEGTNISIKLEKDYIMLAKEKGTAQIIQLPKEICGDDYVSMATALLSSFDEYGNDDSTRAAVLIFDGDYIYEAEYFVIPIPDEQGKQVAKELLQIEQKKVSKFDYPEAVWKKIINANGHEYMIEPANAGIGAMGALDKNTFFMLYMTQLDTTSGQQIPYGEELKEKAIELLLGVNW